MTARDLSASSPGRRNKMAGELIKCVAVLAAIALVAGALLGVMNWLTYVDPELKMMEIVSESLSIPVGNIVKAPERILNDGGKSSVGSCYVAKDEDGRVVSIVYRAIGAGAKSGTLELLVYVGEDGVIQKIEEYSQSETAGYFDRVFEANAGKYAGIDINTIESFSLNGDAPADVDAVARATFTSRAFNNAVNAVVYAFKAYAAETEGV